MLSAATSVRVTVVAGVRRLDLALPAAVPVVELEPELARGLGLLTADRSHAGYRLARTGGGALDGERGLAGQQVADGDVLELTALADEEPPRRYDDRVEAVADRVEDERAAEGPRPRAVRPRWGVALTAVGAAVLVAAPDSAATAGAAVGAAVALLGVAAVLARGHETGGVAAASAWCAASYAGIAGLVLAPPGPWLGAPLAWVGGGVLLAGLGAVLGLCSARVLMLGPIVLGGACLGLGLLAGAGGPDPRPLLPVALAVVVLTGSGFARLAAGLGGLGRHASAGAEAEDTAAEEADDPRASPTCPLRDGDAGDADLDSADGVLAALTLTEALLVVVLVPVVVTAGPTGVLLAGSALLCVLLRSRQQRRVRPRVLGLGSAAVGLTSLVLATVWLAPPGRPWVAVGLAITGGAVLLTRGAPVAPSALRARLAEVVEAIALVSVLPLSLLVSGAVGSLAGLTW